MRDAKVVGVRSTGRYALAASLVLACTALKTAAPALGSGVPFLLYFGTVLVAALYGGRGPGIFAIALSALAGNVLFIHPLGLPAVSPRALLQTIMFIAESSAIVLLSAAVRDAQRRAKAASAERIGALERMQSITAELARAPGTRDIAAIVVEKTAGAIGAPYGGVWLARPGNRLELAYSTGYPEEATARFAELSAGSKMPLARAFAERASIWLESRAEYAARYPEAEAETHDGRGAVETAFASVPLFAGEEAIGVLSLSFRAARRFDAEERRFLETTAYQAAQALERARLFDAEREARERAAAAHQEAEASSRLKDEFLATISHELRTPLTAMLGWSRMVRSGALAADRQGKAMESIERNTVALAGLVEDLLDVSRIISGKLRLDVQPVEPAAFVEGAIEAIRPTVEMKGVRLSVDLDRAASALRGDRARLQQVVWNLLSNAVKFTPRGGAIDVGLRRDDSHVELTVKDTGQGIPPAFLPFVFDRFRQADASFSRAQGGLGLGLAISRHLVELHGGTIHAESGGPAAGSTFRVRLPIAARLSITSAALLPRTTERPPAQPFEEPQELRGLQVLVVEDEADAREIVTEILGACGASVTAAASAREALAYLDRARPDVILSDLGMPELDGYGFIGAVRAQPRLANVPAAALTGYASADDRRRVLLAGFQMHVPKPTEPAELVAVVANLARMGRALG
jgi:signal transduction histidine kinase/ActR/RegA family two-component response regulator